MTRYKWVLTADMHETDTGIVCALLADAQDIATQCTKNPLIWNSYMKSFKRQYPTCKYAVIQTTEPEHNEWGEISP